MVARVGVRDRVRVAAPVDAGAVLARLRGRG